MFPGGFFPKRITPKPAWLHAGHVREVCSVSECVSSGPVEWVTHWRHNDWGWFNTVDDAMSVIPPGEGDNFRIFAYRLHAEEFRLDGRSTLRIPANVHPEPISAGFTSIGFDVFSKSVECGSAAECSPLSCNGLAAEIQVNEYCLIPSLAAALGAAERFAREQPEPGSYYVAEVLMSAHHE